MYSIILISLLFWLLLPLPILKMDKIDVSQGLALGLHLILLTLLILSVLICCCGFRYYYMMVTPLSLSEDLCIPLLGAYLHLDIQQASHVQYSQH